MGFLSWIKNIFARKPKIIIIEDFVPEKKRRIRTEAKLCNICKESINSLTGFYCGYCHNWHCEKHRLPEEHNCKSPAKPDEFKKGYGSKTWIK